MKSNAEGHHMTTSDPIIKEARSRGMWLVFFAICIAALGGIVLSQTSDLRDSLEEEAAVSTVVGNADSQGITQQSDAWSAGDHDARQEQMDKLKQAGGLVLVFAIFLLVFGLADLVRPSPAEERALADWRNSRRGMAGGDRT